MDRIHHLGSLQVYQSEQFSLRAGVTRGSDVVFTTHRQPRQLRNIVVRVFDFLGERLAHTSLPASTAHPGVTDKNPFTKQQVGQKSLTQALGDCAFSQFSCRSNCCELTRSGLGFTLLPLVNRLPADTK